MQALRQNLVLATWFPVIGGAMLTIFGESQVQLAGLMIWGTGVVLQVILGTRYLGPRVRGAAVGLLLPSNISGRSDDYPRSLDETRLIRAFRQAEPLLQRVILEGLSASDGTKGAGSDTP